MAQGEYTKELGKRLTQKLKSKSKYSVYYAHGDSIRENNVCHSTPFFGNYSTASTLSFVDIVVVDSENKKVRIFCEIEESGAPPKKIIGDIVNIIVSEKLRIKGINYEYDRPQLILGIKVKEGGKSEQKAHALIQRLESTIKEPSWNLLDKIRLICDSDIDKLLDKVESEALRLI